MSDPRTIDVSDYPAQAVGSQSAIWWGVLSLILILTSFTVMLAGSYFYLMRNFSAWPPQNIHVYPPVAHPLPELTFSTLSLAVLLFSCVPMYVVDRSARRLQTSPVRTGLIVMVILALVAAILRVMELSNTPIRWDANAYGSIVWGILIVHLLYIYAISVHLLIMTVWTLRKPIHEKHARDLCAVSLLWYWVAGSWVPLYVIVYWSPRFL